ncbi:MAG: sigma 54-interacting transcriptional regulator [Myxococcales bacterium]|nr:sigma 54-interacting transcriptional regulator [Myxococcales bacterium]
MLRARLAYGCAKVRQNVCAILWQIEPSGSFLRVIGRYELVRMLGEGASGEVHLARDRLMGGREVALKRLRVQVDAALTASFEREFATMASLAVPGVAQVYDFGLTASDSGSGEKRPFYTRAYIEGRPLDEAVADQPIGQRLRLFCRVARIVAPLHRAGVVHGDLKPGNAIIDGAGQAHVIDFGLSHLAGRDSAERGVGGTLPYMAPELFERARPTSASDVYALGATLYRLVSGQYPHGKRGLLGAATPTLPPLPGDLGPIETAALRVALRALEPDPLDRLPSVDELIVALEEAAGIGSEQASELFVQPRPRGNSQLLEQLQAETSGLTPAAGSRCVLLVGPEGAGKSSLLRELKWRLQIRAVQVLEVRMSRGEPIAPLRALFRQLELLEAARPFTARGLEDLQHGRLEQGPLSEALAAALAAHRVSAPVVLLVDDIDVAEPIQSAILQSAVFARADASVTLVAAAAQRQAPALAQLGADRSMEVAPLGDEDVAALCTEVLGPVDDSVVAALGKHSENRPGPLLDALLGLRQVSAATAADVEGLPLAGASVALAEERLGHLDEQELRLLALMELLGGRAPAATSSRLVAALAKASGGAAPSADAVGFERSVSRLEAARLVVARPEGLELASPAVARAVHTRAEQLGRAQLAARLMELAEEAGLTVAEKARLAAEAGDAEALAKLAPKAAQELVDQGGHAAAAELLESLRRQGRQALDERCVLSLARCRHALGQLEATVELLGPLLQASDLDSELRIDAATLGARALTELGRLDDAVEVLQGVPEDGRELTRARVMRELAKVHLRRGDYEAVNEAAEAGLESAGEGLLRSELLCSRAAARSYRSDHEAARDDLRQAVDLARSVGSMRDEAVALGTLAFAYFRTGQMIEARDIFSQALELARQLGDVGSMANCSLNLGALLFYLGEPASAAEYYESAARLARRAGRLSTAAQARINAAHVHIYFGLYERAKAELGPVMAHAQDAGQRYIEAQGNALLGDLASRAGDVERGLIKYDEAIGRYRELGQPREIADHQLDAAEALLDRGGPADSSAAAARLSAAREGIEEGKLSDLRARLSLLLARARLASGDVEGSVTALDELIAGCRLPNDRDVLWSAHSVLARAHQELGAHFVARRHHRSAIEVLEEIALRIPREHREAFWHDPRRRLAKALALRSEESSHAEPPSSELGTLVGDPRAERLLEIIKRLASEHDLDRLLERITESAVDLSGAERGLVLLVDESGQLERRTVQVASDAQADPHEAFSRSIAEAVLIDGEPIVSTDASHDARLDAYASVHKLMLRSVACVPIRSRSATIGVLYLEHRRSRGRFDGSGIDLLTAFADQAAIALQNARLLADNVARRKELEQMNAQLEHAKQELEDALSARIGELDEAKKELSRVRRARRDGMMRHGIVGRSAPMLRLFETIDRVKDAIVPVVICGESGTGKELAARAIHYGGVRAAAPFVAVNCGSVPEALLESELFGHVRGAFTGASRDRRGLIAKASGGTLFLDEIGDMPPKMQVDLLRVIQEGTVCKVGSEQEERVDVRFVAASNRPMEVLVAEGKFREDLYYRLNVVELDLAPLRQRREDIPLLCQHFLDGFAERDGRESKRLTREAMELLQDHPLPGNVRQLENVLMQAWVMVDGPVIDAVDLNLPVPRDSELPAPPARFESALPSAAPSAPPTSRSEPPMQAAGNRNQFQEQERARILSALELHGWNRAKAAESLSMPRRTFYRRLRQYEIQ